MSTRHPLAHATLYTVVSGPPDEPPAMYRFPDPVQAERYRTKLIDQCVLREWRKYQGFNDFDAVTAVYRKEAEVVHYILPPQP